jgi:hypothetical protein
MRIVSSIALGAVLLALTPSASSAQDRRWHVNLGGGPTFIAGDLGEHFGTGWGPAVGVTLDGPGGKLGFQFEYAYRYFNIKDSAPFLGATRFSANHQTHQLDFNLVANFAAPGSSVRPYVIAGPGIYNRKVEITEYVGNGVICDPWYYVCGTYPVTDVVGSRGGWDWGFNFGGGVGFGIGENAEFYIETRYHYVPGPEISPTVNPQAGSGGNANGNYTPLTFGFRF